MEELEGFNPEELQRATESADQAIRQAMEAAEQAIDRVLRVATIRDPGTGTL